MRQMVQNCTSEEQGMDDLTELLRIEVLTGSTIGHWLASATRIVPRFEEIANGNLRRLQSHVVEELDRLEAVAIVDVEEGDALSMRNLSEVSQKADARDSRKSSRHSRSHKGAPGDFSPASTKNGRLSSHSSRGDSISNSPSVTMLSNSPWASPTPSKDMRFDTDAARKTGTWRTASHGHSWGHTRSDLVVEELEDSKPLRATGDASPPRERQPPPIDHAPPSLPGAFPTKE